MDAVAGEGEAEGLAHDDQRRHRSLTIAPTEPIPCDEVYMEDINEDEDSDSNSSTPTDSHITRDGGHGWTPMNPGKQVHFNSLSDPGEIVNSEDSWHKEMNQATTKMVS
jgi:hypothetical protein